ncbi:MAG TPA: HAD hydrolase family protein, partial [Fusobacterium sp.]|uniref:HAD family hydrolase n=1 Tax=Fusobacterium sp. TaxID=68766 RepID=UPI002F3FD6B7
MKWVISDLDGTLLNDDRTVGEKTIFGIQTLLKKGYPFVIATGRGFASANTIREK